MPESGAGRAALADLDRALAARPGRDEEALVSAVQNLAAFRDHFVESHRSEPGGRWRATLERVNAVLSVVLAAEFPLGEVPWGEVEKARQWLDDVTSEHIPE